MGVHELYRQKNIRTKDSFKKQMYIQASLVFICLLNVCTCGDFLRLFCLGKNKGGCLLPFVSFKNAVLALQIICMMGMWPYRQELAYAWTDGWASFAFLCSSVLLSLLFVCNLLCVLKECGACTANPLHDGHVAGQAGACLCMD